MSEFNLKAYTRYEDLPPKEKPRFKPVSDGFVLRSAIADIEEAHRQALVERRDRLIARAISEISRVKNNPPSAEDVSMARAADDRALKAFIQGGSLEDFHAAEEVPIPGQVI